MTDPVRVLIVDDSAFARKTLRAVLAAEKTISVVGAARDGLEALEKIAELRPDVVTLDLMMPNLDGLGVLRALPRENAPRVIIVSFTAAPEPTLPCIASRRERVARQQLARLAPTITQALPQPPER